MDRTTVIGSALLAGAVAVLAAAGCGGTGGGSQTPRPASDVDAGAPSAPPDTAVGRVRQVGSTPFTRTLLQSDGDQVRLVGPLIDELRRLVGARVRAFGERVESDPEGEGLRVLSYEILSVDGERPETGLLRYHEEGHYYLERQGGEDLDLQGLSRRLEGHLGAKIWVVIGPGGTVERYGILRPAGDGDGSEGR